jgi:hypothetical protein
LAIAAASIRIPKAGDACRMSAGLWMVSESYLKNVANYKAIINHSDKPFSLASSSGTKLK